MDTILDMNNMNNNNTNNNKLEAVPEAMRIRVLFHDDDLIVIDKPPNLRSVPGNAASSTSLESLPVAGSKRKHPSCDNNNNNNSNNNHLKPQEAWMQAFQSFASRDTAVEQQHGDAIGALLQRWSATLKPGTNVPRKYSTFLRYVQRNHRRIFATREDLDVLQDQDEQAVAKELYGRIQEKQRALLPESTPLTESAMGQLQLLFSVGPQELFTVHRLDCATSGVMVVARNSTAASFLARVWRQRDTVSKTYLALVKDWPPYTKNLKEEPLSSGTIELPLAPSKEEALKWKVDTTKNGKPCKTLWKVLQRTKEQQQVLLELTPVTGRTHQLRIHCAAIIDSGIVGDTLYGTESANNVFGVSRLCLHAHKLSFPHPTTQKQVEFQSEPNW